MTNNSSTGGYLRPAVPAVEDDALDDFIHDIIAGITGLENKNVRPRWQVEPANLPPLGDFWCAFGITRQDPEFNYYAQQNDDDEGTEHMQRHEFLDVMLSFYSSATSARIYAEYWRDGLLIAQNREQLTAAKWGVIDTGGIIAAPSIVKERWHFRSDITTQFKRLITNTYPVLYLLSAKATLHTDVPPREEVLLITDPVTP